MCDRAVEAVLDSLVTLRKMDKWTEIVYLVVPTLNDDDAEFLGLARWIKTNLGLDVRCTSRSFIRSTC